MEIIKCEMEHLEQVSDFYQKVVKYLKETINYPKWSEDYPCRETVLSSILHGEQYACTEDGRVTGAFVHNENPDILLKIPGIRRSVWMSSRIIFRP